MAKTCSWRLAVLSAIGAVWLPVTCGYHMSVGSGSASWMLGVDVRNRRLHVLTLISPATREREGRLRSRADLRDAILARRREACVRSVTWRRWSSVCCGSCGVLAPA
jgi:hypothetical protein